MYEAFTLESLLPKPGAVEMLRGVRERGVRTALVSNCAPDVPVLWPSTVFVDLFDTTIFSCQVGYMKPEREIFQLAVDAVDVPVAKAWFVGDGSDDELSAAVSMGMTAVLVANDLSNTYDSHREDVVGWTGRVVRYLPELLDLFDQSAS
jgi:putative hydrolase of the HAD superfamily